MEVHAAQFDGVVVVTITGSIDALTAPQATEFLLARVAAGETQLVLDLGQVDFMSSAGVRTIMIVLKKNREQGGDLCLAGAHGGVAGVVNLAGLAQVMQVYATVDEAIASYGTAAPGQ